MTATDSPPMLAGKLKQTSRRGVTTRVEATAAPPARAALTPTLPQGERKTEKRAGGSSGAGPGRTRRNAPHRCRTEATMAHKASLIPGEGIGPEVTAAARRVVDASGARIEWEVVEAGLHVMDRYGTALPDHVLDSFDRTRVGIKGPVATPLGKGFNVPVSWTQGGRKSSTPRVYPSISVALRIELDLFANLRPARIYPGIPSRYQNVDLIVVRENTEDLYTGIEHMVTPDVAEAVKFRAGARKRPQVRGAEPGQSHGYHSVRGDDAPPSGRDRGCRSSGAGSRLRPPGRAAHDGRSRGTRRDFPDGGRHHRQDTTRCLAEEKVR